MATSVPVQSPTLCSRPKDSQGQREVTVSKITCVVPLVLILGRCTHNASASLTQGALLLYSGLTMVLGSAVGIMYRLEPKRKN